MPLTSKGDKIMNAMKGQYGADKGESVFYASKNAGTIKGVESRQVKQFAESLRKRAKRGR